jgi:carboxypeptidase Taq
MSYQRLEKAFYRLAQLDHAIAMLGWDQQVMMPPKGNAARGRALAELQVMSTEIMQAPSLLEAMAVAESESGGLEDWQQANLREMVSDIKAANAVPKELVEALAIASNDCEHAWRSLRQDNNWRDFEPLLQKVVDLTVEKAQALNAALRDEKGFANDYEALLDVYDPGTRMKRIDPVFTQLKTELPVLLQEVMERQNAESPPTGQTSPVEKHRQVALAHNIMGILGIDFDASRLDEAAHPFSGGVSDDSRITSRYDELDVFGGIMAVIHECGHSRYETGLNRDWRYRPVGSSMGMGVHESQSLFFEMQLGRSRPFIEAIAPLFSKHLADVPAFSANNMYRLCTRVEPGLIRVNADEVTYPLHVILRYELERDLVLGKAEVKDIPERWDVAMHEHLGLDTTGNYRDGPMQDIHWPSGSIGYFPSYTLGAMNAAQLYHAMQRAIPDAPELVGRLELQPIFEWLSANVWQKGRLHSYDDLMSGATGETLNPRYFLDHLRNRYCRSD